jgi:hypothetical protein
MGWIVFARLTAPQKQSNPLKVRLIGINPDADKAESDD